MPEIKNNFLRSKMNKDLDARLVPNGEYRDALGININQSEGADVGALEVVLGNEEVFSLADDMRFIGRFDDSINNVIYLFATDHTGSSEAPPSSTHQILRFVQGSSVPEILVEGYFLNFSQDNIITGVSLLETQLFFTDNRNQPRVIDVTNALGYYTKEEHISVAKFAPYKSISILFTQNKEVISYTPPRNINVSNAADIQVGDLVYNVTQNAEYGHIQSILGTTITVDKDLSDLNQQPPGYTVAKPPVATDVLRISRSTMTDESNNLFFAGDLDFLEDKFVRFSYRFRYDNNEYSLVAPWTQPTFIPKQFGFFAEKIYDAVDTSPQDEENAFRSTIINWFENRVNQVELKIPFPSNNPVDDYKINQIEILFKESDAVQQQVLERVPIDQVSFDISYKPDQNYYNYTYESKKPYRTLPENVTTRVSDKAPVKALAQELISNRVVYGNFLDRWDPPTIQYTTQANARSSEFSDDVAEYPNHTLKQNRNYSIGVVFYDKYGRASSVVTSDIVSVAGEKISTLYHPYKDKSDVGYGGFTGVYKVYDWLGDQLRINFQQPIPEFPVNNYPGAYAQGTTFTLDTGNTTAITTTAPYTYIIVGGDFTAEMPVNNYLRGYHVDYTKIISSTFAGGATEIITEEQIADIYNYTGGYPGLGTLEPKRAYKINPAGWYSFRIVVQQQEQDYYNVYLPGLTNGFPWNGFEIVSPPSGAANVPLNELFPQNVNRILTTPLISDNINKVPRDLAEVGPDQEQYRSSSTKLFLRVNNTGNLFNLTRTFAGSGYSDATNVPTTTSGSGKGLTVNITQTGGAVDPIIGIYELGYGYQDGDTITILGGSGTATAILNIEDEQNQLYFPGRSDHYVAQIGKQQEILDATAVNDPGNTLLSKYIPYDGYYSSESNPLIAVIELNNQETAGVTYQQWFSKRPLLPRLCVYETEPQQSVLDIYWETSTNGLLSDLNDLIITTFNGVFSLQEFTDNFPEDIDYVATPTAVTSVFYGVDSTGGFASGIAASIIEVKNGEGAIIQTSTTPTADKTFYLTITPQVTGDELQIFCQKNFTYRDISHVVDEYTVTIQTELAGEVTTHDRTIKLRNICPDFTIAMPANGIVNILDVEKDVAAITAIRNGSNPGTDPFPENRIVQTNIEIVSQQLVFPTPTPLDVDIFNLDPLTWDVANETGNSFLRVDETRTTPGEKYVVELRVTDAGQGFGFCQATKFVEVHIGLAPMFVSGPGGAIKSQYLQAGTWTCTPGPTDPPASPSAPLRQWILQDGFFRGEAPSGCTAGCNNVNTFNPIPGDFTKFFTGSNFQDASSVSGQYTIQNIIPELTDLEAEIIQIPSGILNPGTNYSPGIVNVNGGSGINMTVEILNVDPITGGITDVRIANSGTLPPALGGNGPTGYVNGDEVTPIQVGSGNDALLLLDGSDVGISNAFVVAYEVITPFPNIGGNDYQFNQIGTPGKSDFEIVHKYKPNNSGCASNGGGSLLNFSPDNDPVNFTKGYLIFNAPQNGSTSQTLTHVITNIFQQSEKNASTTDTEAGASAGDCNYIDPQTNYKLKSMGTVYFNIKLKAYDPVGQVFGTTLNPGSKTGWTYWDNNRVIAEDTLGMVFSDMPSSWAAYGCTVGINDPRNIRMYTCGGTNELSCP